MHKLLTLLFTFIMGYSTYSQQREIQLSLNKPQVVLTDLGLTIRLQQFKETTNDGYETTAITIHEKEKVNTIEFNRRKSGDTYINARHYVVWENWIIELTGFQKDIAAFLLQPVKEGIPTDNTVTAANIKNRNTDENLSVNSLQAILRSAKIIDPAYAYQRGISVRYSGTFYTGKKGYEIQLYQSGNGSITELVTDKDAATNKFFSFENRYANLLDAERSTGIAISNYYELCHQVFIKARMNLNELLYKDYQEGKCLQELIYRDYIDQTLAILTPATHHLFCGDTLNTESIGGLTLLPLSDQWPNLRLHLSADKKEVLQWITEEKEQVSLDEIRQLFMMTLQNIKNSQ